MADERMYQWSTALQRPDGHLRLVSVAYAEDEYPDAKQRVMEHFRAWQRDAEDAGRTERVVLLRRPIVPWELADE